jgi:pimeloyl-ACP methyl ester carboxylesterase
MKLPVFLLVFVSLASIQVRADECVVLLHGLARTAGSMSVLEETLVGEGYRVANIDYPSREHPIEYLSELAVGTGLAQCEEHDASSVNFVTHSLGGILVRDYYARHPELTPGRVVMLGPPNQGSEVVDNLRDTPGFELINGPAGLQLGTDEGSVPSQLGPVTFELGVIAGTESINLLLSTFLPDPDDGKVSVQSARVSGMCSFLTVPVSHPFLMSDEAVVLQATAFLRSGKFSADNAETFEAGHCPASVD